jgi:galactose-1-phosphate uridylyltransferase
MVAFVKEIEEAVYLDPFDEFREKRVSIEKRTDPLTGQTGRVIPFRFRRPEAKDLKPLIERSTQLPCPFCPDNVDQMTPRFPPSISKEGRVYRGEAVLVPNIFPYEPYSAVVRLTESHFVPMDAFSVSSLVDGILISLDYLKRIRNQNPSIRYGSINCNYMPSAGGGLIHPHFQPVGSTFPTHYMKRMMAASEDYLASHKQIFWEDYLKEEEERGERFIGRMGKVHFLAPFLPGNLLGEVMAVFCGQDNAGKEQGAYADSFAKGLKKVLDGWSDLHFTSFNLSIYLYYENKRGLYTFARMVPRDTLTLMDTSDVNYYEKLHGDNFSVFAPEEMCAQIKPFFAQA